MNGTMAALHEVLEMARADVREAEAKLKEARAIVAALERGIRGPSAYRKPKVRRDGPTEPAALTLRDMALVIVSNAEGITAKEITAAVATGRDVGHNTVLGTLSRLKREGRIHKIGKMWWRSNQRAMT